MDLLEDWSVRPRYVPPASEPVRIDPPSRHVTVRLEREAFEAVVRLARERGCYRQDVLRDAVESYLLHLDGARG